METQTRHNMEHREVQTLKMRNQKILKDFRSWKYRDNKQETTDDKSLTKLKINNNANTKLWVTDPGQ